MNDIVLDRDSNKEFNDNFDAFLKEQRKKFLENKKDQKSFNVTKTDEDKRLVFGWASISMTVDGELLEDRQKDMIEPEDLEESVYDYVLNFRDTGEEHNPTMRKKGKLIESCVFTKDKQKAMGIPEGVLPVGWWIGFYIEDDDAWARVKDGTYKMFSIEGKANREPVEKAAKDILKYNDKHDPKTGRFAPKGGGSWGATMDAEKAKILALDANEQALYVLDHDGETYENCLAAMKNGETEKLVNNYFEIIKENGDPTPTNQTSGQLTNELKKDVESGKYKDYTDAREDYIQKMTDLDKAEAASTLKEMATWFGGGWASADTAVLDKYIEKDHVYDGKMYRGMKFSQEDFDTFIKDVAPGAKIGMKRNSSWSSEEDVARLFAQHVYDDVDSVILTCVKNRTSAPVAHLSTQGEGEVLAHSNAQWSVLHSEVVQLPSGARKAYITVMETGDYK